MSIFITHVQHIQLLKLSDYTSIENLNDKYTVFAVVLNVENKLEAHFIATTENTSFCSYIHLNEIPYINIPLQHWRKYHKLYTTEYIIKLLKSKYNA